jgi:hypothetical protein
MMSGRKQTVWCQQTDNDDDDDVTTTASTQESYIVSHSKDNWHFSSRIYWW